MFFQCRQAAPGRGGSLLSLKQPLRALRCQDKAALASRMAGLERQASSGQACALECLGSQSCCLYASLWQPTRSVSDCYVQLTKQFRSGESRRWIAMPWAGKGARWSAVTAVPLAVNQSVSSHALHE